MLRVAVVTLFPEMLDAVARFGVTARAIERGLLVVERINPRDFTTDRHRSVDDRPYGGGPGMVLRAEPLRAAIAAARERVRAGAPVVYLSPQGRRLTQATCAGSARDGDLILVCGRYEGVDERVLALEVDEEWSIGDYVLSGGELAAMVVIDAVARLVPGVLGHGASAEQDSFASGLLDCGHWTRPEVVGGLRVPEVLVSGDHESIRRWRLKHALGRTWLRRPDLLSGIELDREGAALLEEFMSEHAGCGPGEGPRRSLGRAVKGGE